MNTADTADKKSVGVLARVAKETMRVRVAKGIECEEGSEGVSEGGGIAFSFENVI